MYAKQVCLCENNYHSILTAAQLYAELSQLNLNLPARVCIPLYEGRHQILRVPSSEAVVLNSKSKVHAHVLYVYIVQ